MKANLKTVGIIAVSAALLYIPLKKLFKLIQDTRNGDSDAMDSSSNKPHRKQKAHKRHLLSNKALNWH